MMTGEAQDYRSCAGKASASVVHRPEEQAASLIICQPAEFGAG
jgi:hypothetical protein